MAGLFPTDLKEYCTVFNISFFDIHVPCVFCKHSVSLQNLADFYCKGLSLLWKNNNCYACCSLCLKSIAKYEFEQYFTCSVKCHLIEAVVLKPLKDIVVRCRFCYKLLDYAEKLDCCARNFDFCLVRGHWKNVCRFCIRQV